MNVLQKDPGRLVVLEDEGRVVRKIYFGDDPDYLYGLAAREFRHMLLFREALRGIDEATCPLPIEIRPGQNPYIRMERAAGVAMEDYLNETTCSQEVYDRIGGTIALALPRYTEMFKEPYWDFIIRNIFYEPNRKRITFLDFGIPLAFLPHLDEFAAFSPLEFSLGTFVASPVFEASRPRPQRMLRRREHRQAFDLVTTVVKSFRDGPQGDDLRMDEVRESARIAYRLNAAAGGWLRRAWYRSLARLLVEPTACIDRICAIPK